MMGHPAPANWMSTDRDMNHDQRRIRVLYSFPHKIGSDRICTTAWHQVNGLAMAGAEVKACPGAVSRPLPETVDVHPTLAIGGFRVPYKLLGSMRAFRLHDCIVSRRLRELAGQIDIVHTWPLGAIETLKTARKLGIPAVLERCNAHTAFAIEAVRKECERIGVAMPPGHEHAENPTKVRIEEQEYKIAFRLLCPSDFVMKTFVDKGFPIEKLARHQYGFDDSVYFPGLSARPKKSGLTMLFVGGCAPRKGLHYALEAWLRSPASKDGKFQIAGGFIPGYAEKLSSMLCHPSVTVLGHRNDVPQLMRTSDLLTLPSIEEGSALVTAEARGSGCVLLVSDAAGAVCTHMKDALVHQAGDVDALTEHISLLWNDRNLLQRLRTASIEGAHAITWKTAGVRLLEVYRSVIESHSQEIIEKERDRSRNTVTEVLADQ
jgi:D-inositol-3-phosphate glycosyltransferase